MARYSQERVLTGQWNVCPLADEIEDTLAHVSRATEALGLMDMKLRAELRKRKAESLRIQRPA